MAQRRSFALDDPFVDLEKKAQILEREMAQQRAAMERLKSLAQRDRHGDDGRTHELLPHAHARRTA